MSRLDGVRARLRHFLARGASESRMDEELRFHIEMETEANVRAGMPPGEARRRALLAFGGMERHRERLRETRGLSWADEVWREGIRAVRGVGRHPGFSFVAVLTLALGIGAATAMFSVLNGVLLRPLPVAEQERLVVAWLEAPSRGTDRLPIGWRELTELRESVGSLEALDGVAYQGSVEQVLVDGADAFPVRATWVTGGFFRTLGVRPAVGRLLRPEDDVPGAAPVMVIGHGLWQRRFGGDPGVLGRRVEWSGAPVTIVGVVPPGLDYPSGAEVWMPVLPAFPGTAEAEAPPGEVIVFDLIGRLAPGVGVTTAMQEMQAFYDATDARRAEGARGMRPTLTLLDDVVTEGARGMLRLGAAAAGLLLLISAVNVANLLLIRGSTRGPELAIRRALGAGRRRLLRQLLLEAGVLAGLGGALGILLAYAAVRAVVLLAPAELPRREVIALDPSALLFAGGVTIVCALLAGLVPAFVATSGRTGDPLRSGRRTASGSPGVRRLRQVLVSAQVALAIVVVVGAGLLGRTLYQLQSVDLGFDAERLLIVQTTGVSVPASERSRQVDLQEEMLTRVRAIPEVIDAAAVPVRPFSGEGGWTAMYSGEGQTPEAQAANPWVNFEVVGPEYFATMRMRMRIGRGFSASDREDAPPVAVVSEAVARSTWPGEDPIGKRVKLGPLDAPGPWHTVVGVVGETRYRELATPQATLYLPTRQFGGPVPMSLAVRTRTPSAELLPALRPVLREVDPALLVVGGGGVRELMAEPLARSRFSAFLLAALGATTLLLALVGIHAVMATLVRQRTPELGVRLALGATAGAVRTLVVRQGVAMAGWGAAAGLLLALLGTRWLEGMLYDVRPTDPVTFGAVTLLILGSALLATLLPARNAARIDPADALRAE